MSMAHYDGIARLQLARHSNGLQVVFSRCQFLGPALARSLARLFSVVVIAISQLVLAGCATPVSRYEPVCSDYDNATMLPNDTEARALFRRVRECIPERLRATAAQIVRGFSPKVAVRLELVQDGCGMYYLAWVWKDRECHSYCLTNGIDIHNPSCEAFVLGQCPEDDMAVILEIATYLQGQAVRVAPYVYPQGCGAVAAHVTIWSAGGRRSYVIHEWLLTLNGNPPPPRFADAEANDFLSKASTLVNLMWALPEGMTVR